MPGPGDRSDVDHIDAEEAAPPAPQAQEGDEEAVPAPAHKKRKLCDMRAQGPEEAPPPRRRIRRFKARDSVLQRTTNMPTLHPSLRFHGFVDGRKESWDGDNGLF